MFVYCYVPLPCATSVPCMEFFQRIMTWTVISITITITITILIIIIL